MRAPLCTISWCARWYVDRSVDVIILDKCMGELKTSIRTIYRAKNGVRSGIRTHAPEETGALNQRLRPLGHATYY